MRHITEPGLYGIMSEHEVPTLLHMATCLARRLPCEFPVRGGRNPGAVVEGMLTVVIHSMERLAVDQLYLFCTIARDPQRQARLNVKLCGCGGRAEVRDKGEAWRHERLVREWR